MNLLAFAIGLLICVFLGILLSYFTALNWAPAALLVYAALHFHAAVMDYAGAETDADDAEKPVNKQQSGFIQQHPAIWIWLRTLLVTFILAGLGAYLQIHGG